MLIIFSGLPGVGKSTIAQALAAGLEATYVRIDSIEQAIREAGRASSMDDTGYRVGYAVAEDNLRLGRTVVADSVNPLTITRAAWRQAAARAEAQAVDVEIVCSDRAEHQRRVTTRTIDVRGLRGPTWNEVVAREYDAWDDDDHLIVDSARQSVGECVAAIRAWLPRRG